MQFRVDWLPLQADQPTSTSIRYLVMLLSCTEDLLVDLGDVRQIAGSGAPLDATSHGGGDGLTPGANVIGFDRDHVADDLLCGIVAVLSRFFSRFSSLSKGRRVISAPGGSTKSEGLELDILRLSNAVPDPEHRGFGRTLFIQDPFLPEVNLGRFVDRYSVKKVQNAFKDAAEILNSEDLKVCTEAFQKLSQ
mmetsp:Transcript_24430/g.38422  ORF Transcript_24430/g.38422 Transcript_24430/m.38422 type:complete len:192 (+) Transcript_24430:154-729(+)|eukprot:CAMPEP_0184320868 /NCGR_PEP_ID=MMETSP1049-20130417/116265_1 /TAXON_ID=77928 /ORGANISM="Proteomonas sulcata, Strain CCMP704" /LENGTH=191 /DNA_ID=CAMNT_0026641493 /DNA_START=145 /DNA_END=720 /DNA_ORIENTATION=+